MTPEFEGRFCTVEKDVVALEERMNTHQADYKTWLVEHKEGNRRMAAELRAEFAAHRKEDQQMFAELRAEFASQRTNDTRWVAGLFVAAVAIVLAGYKIL